VYCACAVFDQASTMRPILFATLVACGSSEYIEPPHAEYHVQRARPLDPFLETTPAVSTSTPNAYQARIAEMHAAADRQRQATLDAPRIEEERRAQAAKDAQAKRDAEQAALAQKHASDCKASFPQRLRDAQAQLAQVATKKAAIQGRCRTIQPHCAISQSHSVCVGVTPDDASYYENVCMVLQYADQIAMIDETHDCEDVDDVPLRVSFAATSAEINPIKAARP
jgi:hypothetical protein